jgi:hypothetical protein
MKRYGLSELQRRSLKARAGKAGARSGTVATLLKPARFEERTDALATPDRPRHRRHS